MTNDLYVDKVHGPEWIRLSQLLPGAKYRTKSWTNTETGIPYYGISVKTPDSKIWRNVYVSTKEHSFKALIYFSKHRASTIVKDLNQCRAPDVLKNLM